MPVYKVELYIRECIDSILKQTYQNFELILVDDGSPDNCGKICEEYSRKDKRIIVIHKKNGGLSEARNAGIEIAQGSFITFVDSDDYISDIYLESLCKVQEKYDADIVQGEETRQKHSLLYNNDDVTLKFYNNKNALINLLLFENVKVYAWAKLYKRHLFDNIRYPIGRLNEDCATTYKFIAKAKKIVCSSQKIYFYRNTPNSIMNSQFNNKRFQLWDVPTEIESYLGSETTFYEKYIHYYKFRIGVNLINDSSKSSDVDIKRKREGIIHDLQKIKLDPKMLDYKYKVIFFMIKHFPKLYCFLARSIR